MARSESLQNLLWLNISELSVIKNVTANYLETSYILFFHNFAIYKERFDYRYKDKSNFRKKYIFPLFLENLKIFDASKLQKTRFLSLC